jgi:hypothetical protein
VDKVLAVGGLVLSCLLLLSATVGLPAWWAIQSERKWRQVERQQVLEWRARITEAIDRFDFDLYQDIWLYLDDRDFAEIVGEFESGAEIPLGELKGVREVQARRVNAILLDALSRVEPSLSLNWRSVLSELVLEHVRPELRLARIRRRAPRA